MSQVICLGEILIDCIADEPGLDIAQIQKWTHYPGGAPANVACALTRLGISSSFLGAVGTDAAGAQLISTLQRYGVALDLVQRNPHATTRQVLVTRDQKGDRAFAGFRESDLPFADTQLTFHPQDESYFASAEYLYFGSLILAQLPAREAVYQYLELAQSKGLKLFMDVNLRPMFWAEPQQSQSVILACFETIDYLKVSVEEALWLLNSQRAHEICEQFPNLRGVWITDGEKGCEYMLHNFSGHVPAFRVSAIDTTGAGDGFVAGCLHQLLTQPPIAHPNDAAQWVQYANAVGALMTLQRGAIAPDPTHVSVEHFLRHASDARA